MELDRTGAPLGENLVIRKAPMISIRVCAATSDFRLPCKTLLLRIILAKPSDPLNSQQSLKSAEACCKCSQLSPSPVALPAYGHTRRHPASQSKHILTSLSCAVQVSDARRHSLVGTYDRLCLRAAYLVLIEGKINLPYGDGWKAACQIYLCSGLTPST